MQSEGSSYKVTIFKNSEKSIGLHPLQSGIRNERVKAARKCEYEEEFKFVTDFYQDDFDCQTLKLVTYNV